MQQPFYFELIWPHTVGQVTVTAGGNDHQPQRPWVRTTWLPAGLWRVSAPAVGPPDEPGVGLGLALTGSPRGAGVGPAQKDTGPPHTWELAAESRPTGRSAPQDLTCWLWRSSRSQPPSINTPEAASRSLWPSQEAAPTGRRAVRVQRSGKAAPLPPPAGLPGWV